MKKIILVLGLFLVLSPAWAGELPDHPLIQQAKQTRAPRVQYALKNGAEVHLTSDGKSFYLLWFPEGTSAQDPPPMVATVHGHDSWAFEDFYVWHRFLKERGYGLLAVQWWLGKGEATSDYLLPNEIYRTIDEVFGGLHVKPGSALLHGFSRGSANMYALAALDRNLKKDYFALFIANAGKAHSNYPPTHEIEEGRFGARPFEGSHWVTYAGAKDPDPERSGIPGMRQTGQWIKRYGGTVDLAIEDPNGGHGGFHLNAKNAEAALDVYDKLRVKT